MKLRVAFVGCGWWTTFAHIPTALAAPDVQVVGIADSDPGRLAATENRFGLSAAYADAHEMLATVDCEAVVVATPNSTHYGYARKALELGRHVLLEKPMVVDPTEGWELCTLAQRSGLQMVVGYATHYNTQAQRLKEEIADGRLGDLENVACLYASIVRELYAGNPATYTDVFGYTVHGPAAATYTTPAISGGGQGQSQLTHAAALILWATGLTPTQVAAMTHNSGLPVDLVDGVLVRFDNNAVGTISTTGGLHPDHEEIIELSVFGRSGHAVLNVTQGTCVIHDANGIETLPTLPRNRRVPESGPLLNLIELIRTGGPNHSPPEIGASTAQFVDAMYRSASEGRTIVLTR
ncbi:Gfo/Idh/MocA family oxidoreductase [Micromonosporaceae bacterium B7E4]